MGDIMVSLFEGSSAVGLRESRLVLGLAPLATTVAVKAEWGGFILSTDDILRPSSLDSPKECYMNALLECLNEYWRGAAWFASAGREHSRGGGCGS